MKISSNQKQNLIITGIILLLCVVICILIFIPKGKKEIPNNSPEPTATTETVIFPSINPKDIPSDGDVTSEEFPGVTSDIFLNNKELSAVDKNGGVLTVGVNGANVNGIVIAPKYVLAAPDYKIGYYITNTYRSQLGFSQQNPVSITEEPVVNASNLYIDWTYDKLFSVDYIDDNNYGLKWYIEFNDLTIKSDILNIAVVDMSTHNLLASYDLEIQRNENGAFEIHDIYCTDISIMPENKRKERLMGADINVEEKRNTLINKTIDNIKSGKYITVEEPFKLELATVDLLNNTFHLYYSAPEGLKQATGLTKYPVFAVTVQSVVNSIGHYTFYYDIEDNLIGYDYFRINSESELKPYLL